MYLPEFGSSGSFETSAFHQFSPVAGVVAAGKIWQPLTTGGPPALAFSAAGSAGPASVPFGVVAFPAQPAIMKAAQIAGTLRMVSPPC